MVLPASSALCISFASDFQFLSTVPLNNVMRCLHLGIEFYLHVSHGGMNDRRSTCKFRNFPNLHVDPLSLIPP